MAFDDDKKPTDDGRFRELSSGKLLVWARERAGLSQEQVAKELYMTLTKVRALESDDYRHMGSDTFARGYIRAYAGLVKLDVTQVLAAYERHAQKHGLVEPAVPRRAESPNKPLWQFIALLLVVLFVLWLISIWFFDNRQSEVYERAAVIAPPVETVLNIPQSQGSSSNSSFSSNRTVTTDVLSEVVHSGVDSESALSSMMEASSEAAKDTLKSNSSSSSTSIARNNVKVADALDNIEFLFTDECWVEVSDARGDVLIADLKQAGASLHLQGEAPFDVKLGNAPAVKIELNGNTVDIVPVLGTNVLSIKVGAAASE
jgi:cytoskeleton protein RodZ